MSDLDDVGVYIVVDIFKKLHPISSPNYHDSVCSFAKGKVGRLY